MKIIIKGDFFDCQLIRDRFFVWDSWGIIRVLDYRQDVYNHIGVMSNQSVELIYEDAIHLDNTITAITRMSGGIFPNDSVFVNGHLYTATESGVFRQVVGYGKELFEFSSSRSHKMTDIQVFDLSGGPGELVAMAAGKEGVFEIYNPRTMRVTKSGHDVKDVDKGIYLVSGSTSYNVCYQDRDIYSTDQDGRTRVLSFGSGERWTKQNGKQLRPYIRSNSPDGDLIKLLPTGEGTHREAERSLGLQQFEIWSFSLSRTPNQINRVLGKPRTVSEAVFGTVVEAREEVVIQQLDNAVKRISGPITRTRVLSGFGGKRNLLMVVLNDRIEILDSKAIGAL